MEIIQKKTSLSYDLNRLKLFSFSACTIQFFFIYSGYIYIPALFCVNISATMPDTMPGTVRCSVQGEVISQKQFSAKYSFTYKQHCTYFCAWKAIWEECDGIESKELRQR